jgi:hypothetical protein
MTCVGRVGRAVGVELGFWGEGSIRGRLVGRESASSDGFECFSLGLVLRFSTRLALSLSTR